MTMGDEHSHLRQEISTSRSRAKATALAGKIIAGILGAVLPSVFFLSDAPLWWNRARLFWNEVVHHRAQAESVSPIPVYAVVVPLSTTDEPPDLSVVEVGSGQVLKRLTSDGSGAGAPALSPDRRTIYFPDPSGTCTS